MTKEEINTLAKWMTEVWKCYCKYMQTEMNTWDFDAVIAEMRTIYENSGNDPLIRDLAIDLIEDMDRRLP